MGSESDYDREWDWNTPARCLVCEPDWDWDRHRCRQCMRIEDMKVIEFTRTCSPEDLKLIPKFNQTSGKSKTFIELLQNGIDIVQNIKDKVLVLLSPFQRAKPIINQKVFTPIVMASIVIITLVNFVTVVVRVETERKRLKAAENEKKEQEEG